MASGSGMLAILLGLASLLAASRFYAGNTPEAAPPHERRKFLMWRLPLGAQCGTLPAGLGWILLGVSTLLGDGPMFLIVAGLGWLLLLFGIAAIFWQPRWLQPRWMRTLEVA